MLKNKRGEGYVKVCVLVIVICMILSVFVTFASAVNVVRLTERNSKTVLESYLMKTAGCITGVNWFKDRGEWQDRTYTPQPGDIIYFDWDNKGAAGNQDGLADHVGIVEKIIDDKVFTIEGNTGDQCAERTYTIGYYGILGYGTPAY